MKLLITMIAAMAMWTADAGLGIFWANACAQEEGAFKKALDEAFTKDKIKDAKKVVDEQHKKGRKVTWGDFVEGERIEFEAEIWDGSTKQVKEDLKSANIKLARGKLKGLKPFPVALVVGCVVGGIVGVVLIVAVVYFYRKSRN